MAKCESIILLFYFVVFNWEIALHCVTKLHYKCQKKLLSIYFCYRPFWMVWRLLPRPVIHKVCSACHRWSVRLVQMFFESLCELNFCDSRSTKKILSAPLREKFRNKAVLDHLGSLKQCFLIKNEKYNLIILLKVSVFSVPWTV